MSNRQITKVSVQGNNNITFQYIDSAGNQTEERKSLEEFLRSFLRSYQERIDELKDSLKDQQKIEGLLDEKVWKSSNEKANLERERDIAKDQVMHLLREVNGKDLSQTTDLYREAFEYFLRGELDKALAVLDETRMEEQEKRALETIQQLSETRMLKARILRVDNKFDEAERNYTKAFDLLASWGNCLEIANYFSFLNQFDKAGTYYKMCLEKSVSDSEKATTLNNLANLQSDQNELTEAEKNYREALEIYRKLWKENPQTYLSDVAMTLNNLAVLQSDQNELTEAEKNYREALEIYRKLSEENPQTYVSGVASILHNLAVLQSDQNELTEAERNYREALEIRRELAKENPQKYVPDVAATLISMSIFYQESKIELSMQFADEAITYLLPFADIPYIQDYMKTALDILKDGNLDVEEYLAKKKAENKE